MRTRITSEEPVGLAFERIATGYILLEVAACNFVGASRPQNVSVKIRVKEKPAYLWQKI